MALDDVHGSPTYGKDLVEAIKRLLESGECGTFHVTNAGSATRFQIASALAARVNPEARVRAVGRSAFPSGAPLPTNESVTSRSLRLRPWQEALDEYLSQEWHLGGSPL
jgi:dTDP-4-dehydrorhamnose reductase